MAITVIARDPSRGMILLSGVGFAGVGLMWFPESDHERGYAGYGEARIVDMHTVPDDRGMIGTRPQ